ASYEVKLKDELEKLEKLAKLDEEKSTHKIMNNHAIMRRFVNTCITYIFLVARLILEDNKNVSR
ncbi:hypothetical protein H5410_056197, partial [Solanum commersonii]